MILISLVPACLLPYSPAQLLPKGSIFLLQQAEDMEMEKRKLGVRGIIHLFLIAHSLSLIEKNCAKSRLLV